MSKKTVTLKCKICGKPFKGLKISNPKITCSPTCKYILQKKYYADFKKRNPPKKKSAYCNDPIDVSGFTDYSD